MHSYISLVLLCGLCASAFAQCSSGNSMCNTYQGPACYNPASYSCQPSSVGYVLCGNQNGHQNAACNTTCYDPTAYQCCNGAVAQIGTCSASTSQPTTVAPTTVRPTTVVTTTVAPTTVAPTSSSSPCASGSSACYQSSGVACYNPADYSCPTGTNGPVLCSNVEGRPQQVCGTTCYRTDMYTCCANQIYQIGQSPCGSTTSAPTSSPTSVSTTAAPTTVTPTTVAPTTIVPTTVAPTSTQAPSSQCQANSCGTGLSCCATNTGISCYNASSTQITYQCFQTSQGYSVLCSSNNGPQAICGTRCYYTAEQQCCYGQLLQYAQNCYPPATPTPSSGPIVLGKNITAAAVYDYSFFLSSHSEVVLLGNGTSSFPYQFEWNANRANTEGDGLVLVFNAPVASASSAVLIVTFQGVNFEIVKTSCTQSSYALCNANDMSCYPYRSYYDISICPCASCSEVSTFSTTGGAQYLTMNSPTLTSEISIGSVTFPLTLSFTNGANYQGVYQTNLFSAVLSYTV